MQEIEAPSRPKVRVAMSNASLIICRVGEGVAGWVVVPVVQRQVVYCVCRETHAVSTWSRPNWGEFCCKQIFVDNCFVAAL